MSAVSFVLVIDFLMSPVLDTARDGVGGFFFLVFFSFKFFQIPDLICVYERTFSSINPMHSFMEEVTVHTALLPHFPCPGCYFWFVCFFFVVVLLFF